MNDSTNMWLAIIAISTLVMALLQVGALVAAAIAARRVQARVALLEKQVGQQVQPLLHQLQPVVDRLTVMSADAARISALAVQQAEKADVALTSAAKRMDQTLAVVQNAVVAPAREGMALAAALRAAVGSMKTGARRRPKGPGAEDDDALFIG